MADYNVVEISASEILGGGPRGRRRKPSVFVAYRMSEPRSKEFRKDLGNHLMARRSSESIDVNDGKVETGAYWASEIRKRIKSAKLVVADLTGPSKEVLFEVGFAYGLRKPILPVVMDRASRTDVPEWLTPIQFGIHELDTSLTTLTSDIYKHIRGETSRPPAPFAIGPNRAVWLGGGERFQMQREQFERAAQEYGLAVDTVNVSTGQSRLDIDEDAKERAMSACLIFACLEGNYMDDFIHYVCGAMMARPTAGLGKPAIGRRAYLIVSPSMDGATLIADSAAKCREISLVDINQVRELTRDFGSKYQRWSSPDA